MTMEKTMAKPPVVTSRCKNKTPVSQHEIRKDPWEILNATEHQIRLPHHYFKVGIIPEGPIQTHGYVPDVFPCRRSQQKYWWGGVEESKRFIVFMGIFKSDNATSHV